MYHPMNPALAADPFARLAELRRECPVAYLTHPEYPSLFLVTRYEDALTVYRSCPAAAGKVLGRKVPAAGADEDLVLRLWGPRHGVVRRVLMGALTPRAVREAEPSIDSMCREVVDEIAPPGPLDLLECWAATIPSRAIGRILGFPDADHDIFCSWTMSFTSYLAEASINEMSIDADTALQHQLTEFEEYVESHVARRQGTDAPDDAITRMIQGNRETGAMSDRGLVANIIFLLMAGNTTTQNLLTNTVKHLVESGSYELIRTQRGWLGDVIEESLRVAPPINCAVRVPESDVQVGGVIVPAGVPIAISNLSANHDESIWGPDASAFTPGRDNPNKHLAFASGVHACVGAALARTVAVHAIDALMHRFETIELAPDFRWERRDLWSSWGGKRLDVTCSEDPGYVQRRPVTATPADTDLSSVTRQEAERS
jgi:cytochrome P450